MAVASRGRAELTPKTSPERTKVWAEPKLRAKAQVVYYLSRNGNLEQPHFVEVPFSSVEGLYLRDVISRLHVLRGRAMAGMHSWSCKRSYRNGYVWHDLLEDDFIHPVCRNEYVLKGTQILDFHFSSTPSASMESSASSSISSGKSAETSKCVQDDNFLSSTVKSSDASTQTDEHRRHRRRATPTDEKAKTLTNMVENPATELSQDEISPPPPSSSSPETLEALIKADGYRIVAAEPEEKERVEGGCLSGRVKATEVLMHLISCGSTSVRTSGLSLMPQYSGLLDRAESMGHFPSFRAMRVEEVYFSGSLVETNKPPAGGNGDEVPSLKRSSSYNADGGLEKDLAKENEQVRARCVPRKLKSRKGGRTHK